MPTPTLRTSLSTSSRPSPRQPDQMRRPNLTRYRWAAPQCTHRTSLHSVPTSCVSTSVRPPATMHRLKLYAFIQPTAIKHRMWYSTRKQQITDHPKHADSRSARERHASARILDTPNVNEPPTQIVCPHLDQCVHHFVHALRHGQQVLRATARTSTEAEKRGQSAM